VILETLFGDGSTGLKVLIALVAVLVLLAIAFWLVRRFGGGRLGGGTSRGRQPRLAVIDQAVVDGRRRLVLIRRDNVEHLLIIGGPTDVVVEQNILRAAATVREAAPVRPAAAPDALPRAVPLGDDTTWPLQPEAAPKAEATPRVEPAAPRLEPALRAEATPPEPPATPVLPTPTPPTPAPPLPVTAPAAARERRRVGDPLAGLAEELSRVPAAAEPATSEPRPAARRPAWLRPSTPAAPPPPPVPPPGADATPTPPSDQNLSEMAQRLEAALRRPPKPADKIGDKPTDKAPDKPSEEAPDRIAETPASAPTSAPAAGAPDEFAPPPRPSRFDTSFRRPFRADDLHAATPGPKPTGEPAAGEAPAAPSPRLDAPLRRPFKADDLRATPPAPKPPSEPPAGGHEEGTPAADGAPGKPQKSLYDSLEQEMASLLNRPKP
jgi:flagellar protein FliO/FliZ